MIVSIEVSNSEGIVLRNIEVHWYEEENENSEKDEPQGHHFELLEGMIGNVQRVDVILTYLFNLFITTVNFLADGQQP